jgi:hypothetical protein
VKMLATFSSKSRSVLVLPCLCVAFAAQVVAASGAGLRPASAAVEVSPSQPLRTNAANTDSPSSRVTGPTLGFLFDAHSGSLFRMPGIAGAASLGNRLEVGFRISQAAVGPQQDFVMVTRAGDRQALLIRFLAGAVGVSSLGAATAGVDRIALSPNGLNAALYDAAQGKLTIVTGLPLAPSIVRNVDVSGLTGELTALAIGNDADNVLVASADADAGSVFAVRAEGSLAPVYTGGRVSAIRFLGRQDAVFADASLGKVYLARGLASQATLELLAAEQDGITSPVAIEASRDSRLLFVANSDSGVIATIDRNSRAVAQFSCQCTPTLMNRLTGDSVFQLTAPSEQPVKVFDGGARGPRVLAIPGTPALANDGPPLPPRARARSREARP